ncbi:MAG TPA: hypothetical protein VFQ44_00785 [Streptosporangiaceae bacterium]|nr:hypothetical protein [Streptosporangiaceae bacterium]
MIAAFGILEMIGGPGGLGHPAQSPADTAREAFVVLLASGFASMATIQVAKSLLGLRGLYQERQLWRWFDGGGVGFSELRAALSLSDKSEKSIFDLPIEQLAAQVSAAADFALAEPGRYPDFLRLLTRQGSSVDIPSEADPGGDEISRHYLIRAGIDQLQATVGYRWRNYVRSTAMWLSGLYGIAIVECSRVTGAERGLDILASLLVGGFVSWFARDVTAAIERLRG